MSVLAHLSRDRSRTCVTPADALPTDIDGRRARDARLCQEAAPNFDAGWRLDDETTHLQAPQRSPSDALERMRQQWLFGPASRRGRLADRGVVGGSSARRPRAWGRSSAVRAPTLLLVAGSRTGWRRTCVGACRLAPTGTRRTCPRT